MMNNSRAPTSAAASADEPATLSIGDVAARTGIPETVLRTWESRYGVPSPERAANGRRRYRAHDCELLQEVQRWRATGLSVTAAMARALRPVGPIGPSIFATTRLRHPEVSAHRLPKRALLALSRAIEDECCAGALHSLLVGAFQRPELYAQSRHRWAEFARTATLAIVFADFASNSNPGGNRPVLIKLPGDGAMLREWTVLSYASDRAALLSGWEIPGPPVPDGQRLFETLWSVDPQVVRDAGLAAAGLVAPTEPELARRVTDLLGEPAPPVSEDLRRANGLLDRALDYLWAPSGGTGLR